MTADLLAILLEANLAAAAAILLVLAVRRTARKAFGARLAYALWLVVPLAVGASLLPARTILVTAPALPPLIMEPTGAAAMPTSQAPGITPAVDHPDFSGLVLGLWLAGLIVSGLLLTWRQHRFMAALGGVRMERGYLRAKASDAGPMVVGALRPRIILPTDFEDRFDARERDVVLAHEAAHLKAGDTRINALVALVQCVAWFNPLVHIAARYLRTDQELACDAAVLADRPKDRLLYATALLKAQTHDRALPLGCYWPAGANPLKERIIMLKSQSPSRVRLFAGSALLTALCAGAGAAAWAAQPAQIVMRPAVSPAMNLGGAPSPEHGVTEVEAPARQTLAQLAPARAAVQMNGEVQFEVSFTRPPLRTVTAAALTPRFMPLSEPSTAISPATESAVGSPYTRVYADPAPARLYALMVTMPDGRTGTLVGPTAAQFTPALKEASEAARAAWNVYDKAKQDEATLRASGAPPQPLTPALDAAFKVMTEVSVDRMNTVMAESYAAVDARSDAITVTAHDNRSASSVAALARPATYRTTWLLPKNLTTTAKAQALAQLDAQLTRLSAGVPRQAYAKLREVVAERPTTD